MTIYFMETHSVISQTFVRHNTQSRLEGHGGGGGGGRLQRVRTGRHSGRCTTAEEGLGGGGVSAVTSVGLLGYS